MGSTKKVDKVFHRIEAHREDAREYARCVREIGKFSDELRRPPQVQYSFLIEGGLRTPMYLHSEREVQKKVREQLDLMQAVTVLTPKMRRSIRARSKEWRAGLLADAQSLRRAQDRAGYTEAKRALETASRTERATYRALLQIKPTSSLGIAAMAGYIAKVEWQPYMKVEPEPAIEALRTIGKAAA